jgi:hypothetical protein
VTNPSRPTPADGDPSAFLARLERIEADIAGLKADQPGYGNLSITDRNKLRVPRYYRDIADVDFTEFEGNPGAVGAWDPEVGKFRPGSGMQSIWSQPGAVAVAIGQRFYATVTAPLRFALVSVDVAGTSTTTVVIRKNTTVIATVSLASGVNVARVLLTNVTLAVGATPPTSSDYLRAEVTAAGAGAQRLGIQVG